MSALASLGCVIPPMGEDAPPAAPRGPGRPAIWIGEKLERLKAAYVSGEPVKVIAHKFDTWDSVVCRLAAEGGWPMRRRKRA